MKLTITFFMTCLLSLNIASAANEKKESAQDTFQRPRQQMARIHEQMAACLKSDKSMNECQKEMRNNCRSIMGESGCPRMGRMMGRMGDMMMGRKGGKMGE